MTDLALPTFQHPIVPLTSGQIEQLFADLNPARITQRKQGGSTLSYLESWDVRASLIRVFGFGGFSADVVEDKVLRMDHDIPAWAYNKDRDAPKVQKMENGQPVFNWRVTVQVRFRLYIHQLGATYTESAISSQTGPDVGEVADFAIKTAESDALKRAAINLGTTFGLSLYNKGETADVVRVVRRAGQTAADREALWAEAAYHRNEMRIETAARDAELQAFFIDNKTEKQAADAAQKLRKSLWAEILGGAPAAAAAAGANPATGEVPDEAPAETADETDPIDPAALEQGRGQVAEAFKRG